MIRKKQGKPQEEIEVNWEELGAHLEERASKPKETPVEEAVRRYYDVLQRMRMQGCSNNDIADALTSYNIPGAYSKSVAAALRKEELRRSQVKTPEATLVELSQEFQLQKAAVDALTSEQFYLLKGREAIKVIKILEVSGNGKVDYQILGEAEAKPYTIKVEGLIENLYGPIAQSNLRSVLDRVKEACQTQEAPASSQ